MIYILNLGDRVKLAGSVATPDMLAEGYVRYYGLIPAGNNLRLDRYGRLEAFEPEKPKEK